MTCKVLYLAIFNLAFILPWSGASASSFLGIMESDDGLINDGSLTFGVGLVIQGQSGWNAGSNQAERRFQSIGWKIYENPSVVINEDNPQPDGFSFYYEYTIVTGSWTPQTLLLQLGEGAQASGFTNYSVKKTELAGDPAVNTTAEIGTYYSSDFTNLPANTFGLAFTSMGGNIGNNVLDTTTISFWSKYGPIAANFFTNCGGGGNRAWNTGFDDPENENSSFIMAPVPEPSAYAIAMGFAALVLIVSPRTRKSGFSLTKRS
jgi:hypothetical protein